MKQYEAIKSLADLPSDLIEAEVAKPAQAIPELSPADAKTQHENHLYITAPEHSGLAGYRHWGLNE